MVSTSNSAFYLTIMSTLFVIYWCFRKITSSFVNYSIRIPTRSRAAEKLREYVQKVRPYEYVIAMGFAVLFLFVAIVYYSAHTPQAEKDDFPDCDKTSVSRASLMGAEASRTCTHSVNSHLLALRSLVLHLSLIPSLVQPLSRGEFTGEVRSVHFLSSLTQQGTGGMGWSDRHFRGFHRSVAVRGSSGLLWQLQ